MNGWGSWLGLGLGLMNGWEVVYLWAVARVQLFARAGSEWLGKLVRVRVRVNEWLGSGMSACCSMGPTVC